MKYAEARQNIYTGDLIAVRSRHGGLPAATRWVTRSPYTHTAVALNIGGRLLVAEMNCGGAVLTPASRYAGTDFDVFACPVDRMDVVMAAFDLLGMDIDYDFGDLARIAAHELLGVPLPEADDGNLICSALSASIYLHSGKSRGSLPSIPAPRDVVVWVGGVPTIEIRA